jgi:hypothetical protein
MVSESPLCLGVLGILCEPGTMYRQESRYNALQASAILSMDSQLAWLTYSIVPCGRQLSSRSNFDYAPRDANEPRPLFPVPR